jgi:hypothetical protein
LNWGGLKSLLNTSEVYKPMNLIAHHSYAVKAVALFFLLSTFAGCKNETTGANDTPKPAAQKSSTVKTGPENDKPLALGESYSGDKFEITLLSARRATQHTKTPKPGTGYIVLSYRVKNLSKQEKYGDQGSDLQWKDPSSGMRNGLVRYSGVNVEDPPNSDLKPGEEAVFESVYALPDGLAQVEFHYVPGYNPKEAAKWLISVE